jgi:hypothetical protein
MTALRPLSTLVTLACVAALSGCGIFRAGYADLPKFDSDKAKIPNIKDQPELSELARRFGLMALFSKVVYRNDLGAGAEGSGCNYIPDPKSDKAPEPVPDYGMPRGAERNGRWHRWAEVSENARPCMDEGGLYYETYIHLDGEGKLDEAVIAFRGTENKRGRWLSDWKNNFAAALGLEPSEYKLARKAMPGLLKALEARFARDQKAIKIYATGHSLGGGLAQQLGYLSRNVTEVITFNTTPVTNWTELRLKREIKNDYPTVYRIEHGGEGLRFLRFVASSATNTRFGRYDIVVQLEKGSAFNGCWRRCKSASIRW